MHVDYILREFTSVSALPKRAIRAARAQRGAVTPRFLECLEWGAEEGDGAGSEDSPLFFVICMLAEFREPRAYAPLMKLLASDSERVESIFGDATTECLHRIVVSVFDGDVGPIYRVIHTPEANEFVRDALFDVLAALVVRDRLDRDEVRRFLTDCYAKLEPQSENHVWVGWYKAIAALGLVECHELVREAYRKGFVSREFASWDHVEADLKQGASGEGRDPWLDPTRINPIDDVIALLSGWRFGPSIDPMEAFRRRLTAPEVNPNKNVGRNDPCPCGSGKKFKKCCLSQAAA